MSIVGGASKVAPAVDVANGSIAGLEDGMFDVSTRSGDAVEAALSDLRRLIG